MKFPSNITSLLNNSTTQKVLLVIVAALTVGYFINKYYKAIIFLYLTTGLIYSFNKNLNYALAISIILTNLLLSIINYYNFKITLKPQKQ